MYPHSGYVQKIRKKKGAGGVLRRDKKIMRFLSKRQRALVGSFLITGMLLGVSTVSAPQKAEAGLDFNTLSQFMLMKMGGIPIAGSSATYIPSSFSKSVLPVCYISPNKPELNSKVSAVCYITHLPTNATIKSSTVYPISIPGQRSKVLYTTITMSDKQESAMFSWEIQYEDANKKDSAGKATTQTGTVSATVNIMAYDGSSSLDNNSTGVNDPPTVTPEGNTVTRKCNEDQTICITTTCDTNGTCTSECTGDSCPTGSSTGNDTSNTCPGGDAYVYQDGVCVLNKSGLNGGDDNCPTGQSKDSDGNCVETTTTCTDGTCVDCAGDVCIPYNPSECITATICGTTTPTTPTDPGGTETTDPGGTVTPSGIDVGTEAKKALDDLFGDNTDNSYDANGNDWLNSGTGNDADNLDDYFNNADGTATGDDVPAGATTDDGFYQDGGAGSSGTPTGNGTWDTNGDGITDAWDTDGDGRPDAWDTNGDGEPDAWDTDGDGAPDAWDTDGDGVADKFASGNGGNSSSNGSSGNGSSDGSLGSLLDRYQAGSDGLSDLINGDNSDLLKQITGDGNQSLSDKLAALLGLDDGSTVAPTKSDSDLYDIARQLLLANGMTMDDIMNGRNYDANSAYTEPKTSWDMNRITTLMKSKKLKIDSKGNAVGSSSGSSSSSNAKSSNSSAKNGSASSRATNKNASLTK